MKGRWIGLGAALGLALALTLGFAHAGGSSRPGVGNGVNMMNRGMMGMADVDEVWAAMDRLHDSSAMQDMYAQMPTELRARCEAMHEQMSQMMYEGAVGGMGGMSGGMGWMGGMTGSASHSAHHTGTAGR